MYMGNNECGGTLFDPYILGEGISKNVVLSTPSIAYAQHIFQQKLKVLVLVAIYALTSLVVLLLAYYLLNIV